MTDNRAGLSGFYPAPHLHPTERLPNAGRLDTSNFNPSTAARSARCALSRDAVARLGTTAYYAQRVHRFYDLYCTFNQPNQSSDDDSKYRVSDVAEEKRSASAAQ